MGPPQDPQKYPELVFGIAGPIGIEIDLITEVLSSILESVGYNSSVIKITDHMMSYPVALRPPKSVDFHAEIKYKMDYAKALCKKYDDAATMSRIAVQAIRQLRAGQGGGIQPAHAYIVRQLKRPQEVSFLRRVYGKKFVLLSAYAPRDERKSTLEIQIKRTLPLNVNEATISSKAEELIYRDSHEGSDVAGQHLRDTFHLADLFVDGTHKKEMEQTIGRFVNAFFGRTDISPTKYEYGMYLARSAALRSSDLSRQVGAAVFSPDGDLVTHGCNEVPKAFGGTYWDTEEPDYRDVKIGHDPNDIIKRELIRDLLERLMDSGYLSDKAKKRGTSAELLEHLLKSPSSSLKPQKSSGEGSLADSAITDLTEYGRVVHAEMNAICDAARLGRPIRNTVLFCTTFPCHNCTKHILSAGIRKVIYIEPYPKSRAKELHENEIEIEKDDPAKVSFMPFLGISPVRYRDLFQKSKRKQDGRALTWVENEPRPILDTDDPKYLVLEEYEVSHLFGKLAPLREAQQTPGRKKARHPTR